VVKTLGFKGLALFASFGLTVALVGGCNPEEPAKAPTPPPTPSAKSTPKGADTKGAAPAATPGPKKDDEKPKP
jgi:hypothetical protein